MPRKLTNYEQETIINFNKAEDRLGLKLEESQSKEAQPIRCLLAG